MLALGLELDGGEEEEIADDDEEVGWWVGQRVCLVWFDLPVSTVVYVCVHVYVVLSHACTHPHTPQLPHTHRTRPTLSW